MAPHNTSFGATDIGLVRKNNEDTWQQIPEYGFYALADGMGGHKAGEVASREAIQFLSYSVEELLLNKESTWTVEDVAGFLRLLYENTNSWVYNLSKKNASYKGMGTTLCNILFFNDHLLIGNVGDSRIYQLRDGVFSQISIDHSLQNVLLSEGKSEEVASMSKNILTMAIGTSLEIEPQIDVVSPLPGDVYLLCSDGLSDYVTDIEISEIVQKDIPLNERSKELIEAAKDCGSTDNITLLLVQVCHEQAATQYLPRQQCDNAD